MTIQQVKRVADDCKTASRWAKVKNDFFTSWRDRHSQYRIVGIGRKYVRLMDGRGEIHNETPDAIVSVW